MAQELYKPVDFAELTLAATLNAGVTNELVLNEDITGLETKGWVVIRDSIEGDEVIEYTGRDAGTRKLTGLTRAIAGVDVVHQTGRPVYVANSAQYVRQLVERINTVTSDDHEISTRKLNFKDHTTLSIVSGAITADRSVHKIDTEGAAASDELTTINGGVDGDLLFLRSANANRIVYLKHNAGNIRTAHGHDIRLNPTREIKLQFDGLDWQVINGNHIPRTVQLMVFDAQTPVQAADGQAYFLIDKTLGGGILADVHAQVLTVGGSGNTEIQIHNLTQAVDLLSTKVAIEGSELGSHLATVPPVVDSSNNQVSAYDILRVDVDVVGTSPEPLGLILTLHFELN